MSDDLIDRFDSQFSFWIVIGIGFAKAVENTIELVAEKYVDVILLGLDVSIIVSYLALACLGTFGLIYWQTIKNK